MMHLHHLLASRAAGEAVQPALIARTSAARASTGITGSSPLFLTGSLRR